jgi:hypothetical protein
MSSIITFTYCSNRRDQLDESFGLLDMYKKHFKYHDTPPPTFRHFGGKIKGLSIAETCPGHRTDREVRCEGGLAPVETNQKRTEVMVMCLSGEAKGRKGLAPVTHSEGPSGNVACICILWITRPMLVN